MMPVLEKRGVKLLYYPYSGKFAVQRVDPSRASRASVTRGSMAGARSASAAPTEHKVVFFDHAFADVTWRFGMPSFKSMTFYQDKREVETFEG